MTNFGWGSSLTNWMIMGVAYKQRVQRENEAEERARQRVKEANEMARVRTDLINNIYDFDKTTKTFQNLERMQRGGRQTINVDATKLGEQLQAINDILDNHIEFNYNQMNKFLTEQKRIAIQKQYNRENNL